MKGSSNPPSCIGPIMICMTKDEGTFIVYCEKSQDCPNTWWASTTQCHSCRMLCYLHIQWNVAVKLKKLEISQPLTTKICHDIYVKPSGLLWSDSKEQFDEQAEIILEEWETVERKQRSIQICWIFSEIKAGGYDGENGKVYHARSWTWRWPIPPEHSRSYESYVTQDLYFVESIEYETKSAWFGISGKWEVKEDYR